MKTTLIYILNKIHEGITLIKEEQAALKGDIFNNKKDFENYPKAYHTGWCAKVKHYI